MGTLNVKVYGAGYFAYHVAPEAEFDMSPLDEKSRARLLEYIGERHPLPQKLAQRLQRAVYLQESASGRAFSCLAGCFTIFCFCIPFVPSPDQAAWDMDVDTNELKIYITEQLATVLPVGTWRLIESIQVGSTWEEGRTQFKLHITDPSRREA